MTRRVALIVDGFGISGKTKALAELACGMDHTRFEPTVICFKTEDSPLVAQLEKNGVPWREVPCRDGLDPRNIWQMHQALRTIGPDVVHCYNPRAMLYAGLAASLLGIRATLGSLSAFACHVADRHYDFLPARLFTVSRRNRYRNRMVAALMRRLAVVSQGLGERFCRFNGISTEKLRVVSYGVDVAANGSPAPERDAAIREELGISASEVLVGSVGRLVEQKDYPMQIEGFARAAAREPRLKMVLAGDGPLRNQLERQAERLGIGTNVRFLGHRTDVPRLLRGLDIFVMTSKFEPFGVALLEAKAAGLPIVSTAVNEVPEILGHGSSGILVESGAVGDFADALVRLTESADLRSGLAREALREAREKHSLRAMIDGYQSLYDELR